MFSFLIMKCFILKPINLLKELSQSQTRPVTVSLDTTTFFYLSAFAILAPSTSVFRLHPAKCLALVIKNNIPLCCLILKPFGYAIILKARDSCIEKKYLPNFPQTFLTLKIIEINQKNVINYKIKLDINAINTKK